MYFLSNYIVYPLLIIVNIHAERQVLMKPDPNAMQNNQFGILYSFLDRKNQKLNRFFNLAKGRGVGGECPEPNYFVFVLEF